MIYPHLIDLYLLTAIIGPMVGLVSGLFIPALYGGES